jgi:hypothetical protein
MSSGRRDFIKLMTGGSLSMAVGPRLSASTFDGYAERAAADQSDRSSSRSIFIKTDVFVAGGGLAGVCAALAAARSGARVVLVQDRSRLGGNSSSEIRMHVLGANSPSQLRLWRETGLIEEFKLTDAATNPQRSFEIWDLMLYDKIVSEKSIELLLDTSVISAVVVDSRIVKAIAACPLIGSTYEIEAKQFIDCTGDAALAAFAGADLMRGREAKSDFGELLAQEHADLKTMGNSILLFARKHPTPMPFMAPKWAKHFSAADFAHRPINSYEYGYWWVEWGGEIDTIRDDQEIRRELLAMVMGVWDYIKNSGDHPDARNWALEWVGMIPGKRESRRIAGDHILTQSDLQSTVQFPDRVAYGGWPIDDHPPVGIGQTDVPPTREVDFSRPYHIPLRALYSRNRSNLFMAGRNISATHVALASTRVMATCSTMGQAVGTAAAWCVQHDINPRSLANDRDELAHFQQELLRGDQAVLGVANDDARDLARNAVISASNETSAGKAAFVTDGWNRDIGDGCSHQWQAPLHESPVWIQLTWNTPIVLSRIDLTFDSQLDKLLYLSGQDVEYFAQVRSAQPRTIADYTIEARRRGVFVEMDHAKGNFLRLVHHHFASIETDAIRITVSRTNGDALARIFQVRCYE